MELNLPTGIPMVYELDKNLKPIKPMQFLGDEETMRKAMEAVAAQGKQQIAFPRITLLPCPGPPYSSAPLPGTCPTDDICRHHKL